VRYRTHGFPWAGSGQEAVTLVCEGGEGEPPKRFFMDKPVIYAGFFFI
jgi:hypothetical protein